MQQLLRNIPPQIEREQPVIFEDAHGRITPVHVEFVNSFDAFQAVLVTRFQNMPGLRMVRNLQYSMQDARSQEILDLSKPWGNNFRPGRRLNMSMVFQLVHYRISACPGCLMESFNHQGTGDADVQWYVKVFCLLTPIKRTYEHCTDRTNGSNNSDCHMFYRCISDANNPQLAKRRVSQFFGFTESPMHCIRKHNINNEDRLEKIREFRRVEIVLISASMTDLLSELCSRLL